MNSYPGGKGSTYPGDVMEEHIDNGGKYFHKIIGERNGKIDIYGIAHTFGLTAGRYHAVKKILCAGKRGVKNEKQDLEEAIVALQREIEIINQNKD